MKIAFLAPKDCENDSVISAESYTNNISIAVILYFGQKYRILFPGDLQKEGMNAFLNPNSPLYNAHRDAFSKELKKGVDILICPHHGLRSSFSTSLFSAMKDGKTKMLNIVPEKQTTPDDKRQVDGRYSTTDYCMGNNNLTTKGNTVCQRKTSMGHIFINDNRNISLYGDIDDVINLF
jgi:hypothetical protein